MPTYWLLGRTQAYRSLLEAAHNRAVTISNLHTENKREPPTLTSNTAASTSLKVPEVKFAHGDHSDVTSLMTQTSSLTKNNVINKMKEKQTTCPFNGAHLI